MIYLWRNSPHIRVPSRIAPSMNAAGSVVLDAAISALVASRQQRRFADEEHDDYYYSDTSRRRGRRPRRATVRTAAAAAESSIVAFCQTLLSLIKRTIYISFVSTVILTLSVLTYGLIYNLSMPRLAIRSPLYFDYNFVPERHLSGAYGQYIEHQGRRFCSSGSDQGQGDDEKKMRQCTELTRDTRPAPPTAVVELNMQHTQWHAYHEEVLPVTYDDASGAHVIKPKKRHFVDLALTLPESDLNRQLGMLMVEVDLLASDGTLLASSGRPTMLPHESLLIGVARKVVLMGPILIGAVAEARTVVLEAFDSYVESPDMPLAAIVVRLFVPRSTKSDYGHYAMIQVHSGEVRIGKELNAIQGIMKVWFYSVGLAAVTVLSFFYAFWFLVIRAWCRRQMRHYYSTNRRTAAGARNNQGEFDFDYDADDDNGSEWDNMGNHNDDANEGGADNQSMESGDGFVELDESDDENWDSIHETNQNNEQGSAMDGSFTRDGDDENVGGDQSIGGVEDRAARVVHGNGNGNGNDGLSPGDDLESLAEELVNDLSFDISEVDLKSVAEGKNPPVAADETSPGGSDTTHGRQNRSCKINDGSNVPSSSKKRKGRRSKKKRNNRDAAATTANNKNASRGVTNATRSGNMRSEAEERLKAEKVMRGDFSPTFEVFTDLDEPDEPDPVV